MVLSSTHMLLGLFISSQVPVRILDTRTWVGHLDALFWAKK
ncbi:hypothetical protein BVRB_6g153200 [Beta vulgaris subsp. vulgaris]|nr:hypothetical protein BVRB_6g153200 [Beta vulgaris subsp. vulgaris]